MSPDEPVMVPLTASFDYFQVNDAHVFRPGVSKKVIELEFINDQKSRPLLKRLINLLKHFSLNLAVLRI